MKFVALVSGGKDSCFNILHCLSNGHELVCLANLYPPPSESDELDSFMYQTVGYDVLEHYSECVGKPLYRRMITGRSANQQLEYRLTKDDETEDLYELLRTVLHSHPDVEAVSVGAILSSYQRTRVEDVCARLGVTALSYLWQRDQTELMQEMCESGLDARLIKVAAIGLDERHLGMTLQQAYPVLLSLHERFGVHVCGEGGEFETLVFDAPFFTHAKLVVTGQTVVKHTNDDVWYLRLQVAVEPKQSPTALPQIQHPPLLRDDFEEIKCVLPKLETLGSRTPTPQVTQTWELSSTKLNGKLYVGNITSSCTSLDEQVRDIFAQLQTHLTSHTLTFANVQSSTLLVSSMDHFAQINAIYSSYFTEPLPPARACVETVLPAGQYVQLSVCVLDGLRAKQGLHVQGRSYWAPANIGPYSQAVLDSRDLVAHVSGQIPLVPRDMSVCRDPCTATALSLQHFDSVKQAVACNTGVYTCCYVCDPAWVSLATAAYREYVAQAGSEPEAPFVAVQVTALPRGVDIEWAGQCVRKTSIDPMYEDSDDEAEPESPVSIAFGSGDKELLQFRDDRHYVFYGVLEGSIVGQLPQSYEVVPATAVFDSKGVEHRLAVVEMH